MGQRDSNSATVGFRCTPRLAAPQFATADTTVAAPPQVARAARASVTTRLLPVVMAFVTAGMMVMIFSARSGMARNPMFLAFPLMTLAGAVVTAATGRDRRRTELDADRADYLDYLCELRGVVRETAAAQHSSLAWCHPAPGALWTLVGGPRMWERRPADSDFCHARVGVGTQRLATRLVPPRIGPLGQLDPLTVTALRSFLRAHSTIRDAPIAIALRGLAAVTITGEPTYARSLARAMICQLAVLHSPDQVLIAAAVSDSNRVHWDWLKWLPHNQHPSAADDVGSARMVYPTIAAAENALAGLPHDRRATPQLVTIVDGDVADGSERLAGRDGVTLIKIGTGGDELASAEVISLRVTDKDLTVGDEVFARPDQMDPDAALVCARRLAAYRVAEPERTTGGSPRWQDLSGVGDPALFAPKELWGNRRHHEPLRVPVGTTTAGTPLELDIKEAAENGVGPHGLCIGATGSGKSEFLRTVALGMLARHPPEALNLVLVDFKGGATFLGLESAPHVAAVITNLSHEAPLVARMQEALSGEINRRQELLRAAGNLDGIAAYQRARRAGAQLVALPALLIIIDEFSELLSQHPDFIDVFMAIGRLGRSLGMHLLLASQRLDEGRLRGLDSHLSYRVCLKTLSATESRLVLGTPDAHELPNTPGIGYLRAGTANLVRFQTAFVSGPCVSNGHAVAPLPAAPNQERMPLAQRFTAAPAGPVTPVLRTKTDATASRTVLRTVVDRLAGHGPPAHEVWLSPLRAAPGLDDVLDQSAPELTAAIGIVDRPFQQRRTPLTVDLRGAAGNVVVVGAPQSGKSTTLLTLIAALAATHDPRRVQFYCLDFGGGALTSLRSWPHVGSVAGRADHHLVRRMIDECEKIVTTREALFRDHGIESMAHYRRLKAQHDPVCDRFGDVFLVIDGWAGLCREFDMIETSVTALAAQGLSFGVHVVVAVSRWAELRHALKDQIGTRIELRLGDPADSELDRRRAQQVPEGKPGHGLCGERLHMMISLPRLDGATGSSGLGEAGARDGEMLRRRHGGYTAPAVPLLPTHVDHPAVVERAADDLRTRILLGLGDREIEPVAIDFERNQHLIVFGDNECGKTATLRTLCREISRTTTGARAQLFVADFRRTLAGVVDPEHCGGYSVSAMSLAAMLADLLDLLRRRMPPPDVTCDQLRTGSWWTGPDIYVVVDDYDLVATGGDNPLAPVVEYLPHARDIGLHLLVARRGGGAARAMFEPLLAALRDFGAMALIMSGSPDEGQLIGSVRPSPLPPGRGVLITRNDGRQLVQVSWSPPS
jgi:S-DNA-T family DNA segregation ATPase FtsK/SpoIIIE